MHRVLVTGANGLLGSNLVRELIKQGYNVRAMVRPNASINALKGLPIEVVYGKITEKEDLRIAITNCDFAIHTAAQTLMWPTNIQPLRKANVDAVKYIAEICAESKIKRLIYVSSVNTIDNGTKEHPGNEKKGFPKLFEKSGYALSKKMAESVIEDAIQYKNLDAVIVNPAFLIGPFDSKPSSGRLIQMLFGRRFLFVPPGGKSFLDVRDASVAICNALTMAESGERYLLSGISLSYREFARIVTSSKRCSIVTIPTFMLQFLGSLGSIVSIFGIKTALNYPNSRILCTEFYYDNAKVIRNLQMPITPIVLAVHDAIAWFKENGSL